MRLLLLITSYFVASVIGTEGTFFPPATRSFLDVDFFVGWPVNATTPNGLVAITPNAAGTVTGAFNGSMVGNLTAAVEVFQPSETGLYSVYENELLLANEDEENIRVKMKGITTYGNGGLHGFAHVTFETTLPHLLWTNYAMFVGEWVASLNSGTGNAKLQIFEVTSGGRSNGEPINALQPPVR